jgi:hypothetical protein
VIDYRNRWPENGLLNGAAGPPAKRSGTKVSIYPASITLTIFHL